jgi:IS5 family transposase
LRKPGIVQGDRGYSSNKHRQALRKQGIVPELARIGAPHGSGLGKTRWVVERSIAWLHNFRRLKIRYERYDWRPQKRGATPISYKVLQCPTKLLHTSTFNLKNASPSQAYDCRM